MSYETYKLLHVVGIMALFLSLGGLAVPTTALRRVALATHGIALALILVAGFGLLARLDILGSIPGWAWAKVGVWLLLGATPAVLKRASGSVRVLWVLLPLLGGVATYLALNKPF